MRNKQKLKKKSIELGPLNLSKSKYKPYFGSFPHRNKQNILTMSPLQNIMFDIPPIQQTPQSLQITSVEILRNKITKHFEEKSSKLKEHWQFYIKKSQIVVSANNAWLQLQIYLLKIISELFINCKSLNQTNIQLQKYKQQTFDSSQNFIRSSQQTQNYFKTKNSANTTKNISSLNQLSNIIKTAQNNSKLLPKTKYKDQSLHHSNDTPPQFPISKIVDISQNFQLKISKLQKQLSLYKQKIKTIQSHYQHKLHLIQQKIKSSYDHQHHSNIQFNAKFINQVDNQNLYSHFITQQFNALKKKFNDLSNNYNLLLKQCQNLKQQNKQLSKLYQFKQLWLMQHQQILQIKQQLQQIKYHKQLQIKKNKGLKQKLKQLSKNYNYNQNISFQNQNNKQDITFIIKQFKQWLLFFSVPRVSKGMVYHNTFFPQMKFDTPKDHNYLKLLPNDDQTNYKLLRPNFFIYFQAYEGIILAQRKFPQNRVMSSSFYLMIRAILDAMYLHLTFTIDYKQWSTFPQFVISFLQKFQINPQLLKVVPRKNICQSQQKINFILNIFNNQATNSWQCDIFRNFIMEEFTMDQLYFYLQCRDLLLKGSQLNNNFGSFDPITFIRVSTAEQIIKQKLKSYDRQMLQKIKKLINSKKKVKNFRELIDVNFVLKLLLQVYSIEKIKSQKFFHYNFKTKNQSSKISYTQYSAFMSKNFQFLTKGDIAKLYREMYTLSLGHITYKTIHYVCLTRGLFIPLLRQRQIKPSPYSIDKNNKPFEDITYLSIQNNLNNIASCIQQYGIQQITGIEISFNKFLHHIDKTKIFRNNFQHFFLKQLSKIIKIKSILYWKYNKSLQYQQISQQQIKQRLAKLLSFLNETNDNLAICHKSRDNRERTLKKIIKNFKIRIQQSISQFKTLNRKQLDQKINNNIIQHPINKSIINSKLNNTPNLFIQ